MQQSRGTHDLVRVCQVFLMGALECFVVWKSKSLASTRVALCTRVSAWLAHVLLGMLSHVYVSVFERMHADTLGPACRRERVHSSIR